MRATTDRSYNAARDPVQWTWTADEIRRCCNAMRPKSGALSAVNGRRLALWDVAPCGIDATAAGDPGEVIAIDSEGTPRVRCGDGAVSIMGAVFRGQVMSGRRLVRALSLKLGDRFARIDRRSA
jgi:methionyl-tRNA formyltransferase